MENPRSRQKAKLVKFLWIIEIHKKRRSVIAIPMCEPYHAQIMTSSNMRDTSEEVWTIADASYSNLTVGNVSV